MDSKKILLLIIFTLLVLIPATRASATQVYVGVAIVRATAPGYVSTASSCSSGSCPSGYVCSSGYCYPADSNWCLPGGHIDNTTTNTTVGTQMAITKSDTCSYTSDNNPASSMCYECTYYAGISNYCLSANPVYETSPTCIGNTIWSGLLDLTNSSAYNVYLYMPSFCSGYYSGGNQCLEIDTDNENCNNVCSHYGQTPVNSGTQCYYYGDYNDNCSEIAALKGSPCTTCTNAATYSWFDNSGNCNYNDSYDQSPATCATSPGAGYTRVCDCYFASSNGTGLLFPFTASF
jgi:hypothetical protein